MSRLLIVDDEERIRDIIKKYAQFEGFETVEAVDGLQAVEICRKESFDLIIMDVMMPELDGFSGGSSGVFVVMATNYPERIDPAILRAGRIDLHVEVPPLDKPARGYFFQKLRDLPGGENLDLDPLVRLSSGMSGADLERMKRELALDLVRRSKGRVEQRDAEEMLRLRA